MPVRELSPNESFVPLPGHTPEGRPIVQNPDGSVSTERSITVTDPRLNEGRATNIPSMFGGKELSEQEAIERIVGAGGKDPETGRAMEGFNSIDEAVAAARQRSDQIGQQIATGPRVRELRADEQVLPPAPIVGPTGVESGSAAMQLGTEFAAQREQKRQIKIGEVSTILGDAYDPEETFSGGVSGFWTQIDITRSADLSDKQKKFRKSYPDGDLISVPTTGGPVVLVRPDKSSPYRELSMGPKAAGALASEPVVGGVAGSMFGPIGTLAGTAGGVFAQQGIEKARGFGEGEGGVGRAIEEGGTAGGLDLVMRGAGRVVFGRGRTQAEAAAMQDAVKAARELGLEPLTIGQVGGPFTRGMFRQVGATSSRIERKITAQERSLLDSFRRLGDGVPQGTSEETLLTVVRAQQNELNDMMRLPTLRRVEAGTALQTGIETYSKASRRLVGRLYDKAIALSDDVTFNLRPAQKVASEVEAGVMGRAATGDEAVRLSATPQGELSRVVEDILTLDPTVAKFGARGQEWTSFKQIKTLRTRLFDLRQSDDGGVRREATKLWRALTETMDQPVSGNPDFTKAYRQASAANRLREDTLEKTFIAQAIRSDTPETLAAKYMRPGNATALATIRDVVPRPRFEEFRTSFMVDVMNARTAQQGLGRLETFRATDPDGLRILVTPGEERALESYLRRKAQFEGSPAREMLSRQMTEGERFVAMAQKGTTGEVADAVRLGGGLDSSYAQQARAGVYKSILDEATTTTPQGIQVLDAGKLLSSIERWRKSGKLDALMRPSDFRRLEMYERYAAPLSEAADIGGGMMAGSLRQRAIEAPTTMWSDAKKIAVKVVRPLYSNDIAARVLTLPAAYARLSGAPGTRMPLREAALALSIAEDELSR